MYATIYSCHMRFSEIRVKLIAIRYSRTFEQVSHHFFNNAYGDDIKIRWHDQAGDAGETLRVTKKGVMSRGPNCSCLLPRLSPALLLVCNFSSLRLPTSSQHNIQTVYLRHPFRSHHLSLLRNRYELAILALINHQHVDCLNGDRPWYLQRRRLDTSIREQALIFRGCCSNIG